MLLILHNNVYLHGGTDPFIFHGQKVDDNLYWAVFCQEKKGGGVHLWNFPIVDVDI